MATEAKVESVSPAWDTTLFTAMGLCGRWPQVAQIVADYLVGSSADPATLKEVVGLLTAEEREKGHNRCDAYAVHNALRVIHSGKPNHRVGNANIINDYDRAPLE